MSRNRRTFVIVSTRKFQDRLEFVCIISHQRIQETREFLCNISHQKFQETQCFTIFPTRNSKNCVNICNIFHQNFQERFEFLQYFCWYLLVPQHGSQFVLHLLGTLQIMCDWQITENTQLIILHMSECGQKGLEHLFLLSLLVLQNGSQFALHLL